MVKTMYLFSFVETPRKFIDIIAKLSIRKLESSRIISTDKDPSLGIENFAIINLRGVSTKLNKYKEILTNVAIFYLTGLTGHYIRLITRSLLPE